MTGKVSLRTIYVISLLFFGIVLILGACLNPVDVDAFLKDDTVKGVIGKNQEKVIIDLASNCFSYLEAGNKKISGLNPNKYYMIESEKDEDGLPVTSPTYPLYIDSSGLRNKELFLIGRVSGGNILNLKNKHTYKVMEAEAFTGTVSVTNGTPASTSITTGVINITPKTAGNIILGGLSPQYNGYEVMAVAVLPSPPSLSITSDFATDTVTLDSVKTSFKLEGESRTVDYVFAKITGTTIEGFKFLKVVTKPVGGTTIPINVNITFKTISEQTTTSLTNNATISIKNLSNTEDVVLTLGGTPPTTVEWRHNGSVITGKTGMTLTLRNEDTPDDLKYLIIGKHIFTAFVTIDGKPYSAEFELTVVE